MMAAAVAAGAAVEWCKCSSNNGAAAVAADRCKCWTFVDVDDACTAIISDWRVKATENRLANVSRNHWVCHT